MKDIKQMLTFDDVLLKPHYSNVLPKEVNVETIISNKFKLNIPIMSASMDTITEINMAYNMAINGGIGVIHKNLSINQQSNMIKQLKKIKNGYSYSVLAFDVKTKAFTIWSKIFNEFVDDYIFITKDEKIAGFLTKDDLQNFNFDDNQTLESYIYQNQKIIYGDYYDSPINIYNLMNTYKINYVPLVDNKKIVAIAKRKWLEPFFDSENALLDKNGFVKVLGAIGVGENSIDRAEKLIEAKADGIVIDCAHGHSQKVIDLIKEIKAKYPNIFLIAGNVVTKEAIKDLANAKVDAIKVGIGPGSICTTRIISGVGVPQFSAILETVEEAKKHNISIIADGGIKTSGDIVKALAAGASAIMVGSLVAGCDESPSDKVYLDNKIYKKYRGMGSMSAMKAGSADRYGQEGAKKLVAEGIEGLIEYKGALKDTLFQLVGGLRSGMGYLGAKNLKELETNAEFIQQTAIGLKESNAHSVTIISDNKK